MVRTSLLAIGLVALLQGAVAGQALDALPGADWGGVGGDPKDDPAPVLAPRDLGPPAPVVAPPVVPQPAAPAPAVPPVNPNAGGQSRRTNPFNPPPGLNQPTYNQRPVYMPPASLPRSAQNVMDLYAGATSQRVLAQMSDRPSSGRQPATSGPVAPPRPRQGGKPFQGVSSSPTVSPYLNLFREEDSTELPNYFTFVRPMQEQQRTNRLQHQELMRLRRQVQTMPYGAQSTAMGTGSGALPSTGHGARYFNTSGYFPTTRTMR